MGSPSDDPFDDMPPTLERFVTIAAVGASAGGLEALRELFAAAKPDRRLCFVVVTHLPAHSVSYLAELLARAGQLPASEAVDDQVLEGAHVYVMPPGQLMNLHNGRLRFEEARVGRSPSPKPIDFFMTSMAEAAPDRSIGIVLSGTDHDGTLGLKAIKAAGGLTVAQSPGTAAFAGMPSSAIDAGAADLVLPPASIPDALIEFLGRSQVANVYDFNADGDGTDRLNEILAIVRARTGHDFQWYRPGMLRRRLRRRMVLMRCHRVADYVQVLEQSPSEAQMLSAEFLIGVTDFFRDPDAWQELAEVLAPALSERLADDAPFRVWTPGCSSGQESYSIAMLLLELLEEKQLEPAVQVFGTDIDHEALAVARQGLYPNGIAATVSPQRLAKFFEQRGDKFAVRKAVREVVMFAPQNLVRDTPFSRLDLVCCRNVLMYFEPPLQDLVYQLFHFALKPGGLLWLGKAESLGASRTLFEPVSRGNRLFRRVGIRSHLPRGFAGLRNTAGTVAWQRGTAQRTLSGAEILRKHTAGHAVAAAVLTDREGRALHFQGDTAGFLAPQGDATLELARMVRPELRAPLRNVVRQALSEGRRISRGAAWGTGHKVERVVVHAEPAIDSDGRGYTVIQFVRTSDTAGFGSALPGMEAVAQASTLEVELEESRRELALALEDAERNNEELRMATEESSALNEELQSSNEELESSKEELQSLNEELVTVNGQLEDKIVEVARHADDLSNLLDSTDIATLVLDGELRLRRFTPAAAKLFSLRAGDEGRPLSDLSTRLEDPQFSAHAQAALGGHPMQEAEVRSTGGEVLLRRIQPYLDASRRVRGVVATLVDVSPLRAAARQLDELLAVLADSNDAVFMYDLEGRILSWNRGAQAMYGHTAEQALGTDLFALVADEARDEARDLIRAVVEEGSSGPLDVSRRTRDGRALKVSLTASALRDDTGAVSAVLSTERDITARLRAESEMHFRRLADCIPALLRVESPLGIAVFINQACAEFVGRPREALLGQGWLEFVHPKDRERYVDEHAQAQARRARLEIDLRLLRSDNTYRWMRAISVPHFDPDGSFAGYVALMLDVDDRKQAEVGLVNADRRKDEFLAMLAHELRNPLAPIGSAVQILKRSEHADHRAEWSVGVIERQTAILARLLDDLLDVARISRGKAVLDLAPLELRVVIEKSVEACQPLIGARRQQLSVDVQEGLVVEGDVTRLSQVLINLLNNAAKYTHEGGSVRVAVVREGDEVVIRVSDNGAGLTEDMAKRAFDLFAQADHTLDRSQGGLGIGLTLARQLVELHHGSIQAESPGLGQGSTFTVRLPVLERETRTAAPGEAAPPPTAGDVRKVLVVDDNEDGANMIAELLRMDGHDVSIARTGPEAVEMAEGAPPDVVLLDIGLPGLDGYQVARRLRSLHTTRTATIIAMTGYGQAEDRARAREAGFDVHLVKPLDFTALAEAVASAKRPPA